MILFGILLAIITILAFLNTGGVVLVHEVIFIYLLPQILLIFISAWAFLRRRMGWATNSPLVVLVLGKKITTKIFYMIYSLIENSQKSERKKNQVEAAAGLVVSRLKVRHEAVSWPLITALQKAGVCYAVTTVLIILLKCAGSHIYFGWATSMKAVNVDSVNCIASYMALPWSWFYTEGIPTYTEVKASQVYASQPLASDFPRLSFWWIFLVLSLLVYTVIPRIILLSYSVWRYKKALSIESFKDGASDRLYRRLVQPDFTTVVSRYEPESVSKTTVREVADSEYKTNSSEPSPNEKVLMPAAHCEILTELDLDDDQKQSLSNAIQEKLSIVVSSFKKPHTPPERRAYLQNLAGYDWEDEIPRILVLLGASDPITVQLKRMVEGVFEQLGTDAHVIFCLLPTSLDLSDTIYQQEVDVWIEYVNRLRLKHSQVRLETLTQSQS